MVVGAGDGPWLVSYLGLYGVNEPQSRKRGRQQRHALTRDVCVMRVIYRHGTGAADCPRIKHGRNLTQTRLISTHSLAFKSSQSPFELTNGGAGKHPLSNYAPFIDPTLRYEPLLVLLGEQPAARSDFDKREEQGLRVAPASGMGGEFRDRCEGKPSNYASDVPWNCCLHSHATVGLIKLDRTQVYHANESAILGRSSALRRAYRGPGGLSPPFPRNPRVWSQLQRVATVW